MNHREIASIMAVTGTILPKQYANAITRHEQNKNCLMQHLLEINQNKQKTEKLLSCPILCPLCHLHKRKIDKNEVNTIQNLLQCSRSSEYCQQKTASTKRGHLIAQVKTTAVKWSIKPCIVRTKKVSKALRQELVDWIMKILNVRQSPINRDTLIIADADSKLKRRVPKLLL